jgi:hypothetical protein
MSRYLYLLILLSIFVTGCKKDAVDVSPSGAAPQDAVKELTQKQADLQTNIREAMELYKEFAGKVKQGKENLKEALGDKPYSEAQKVFQTGKVPPELRTAYSRYRLLIPEETQRLRIRAWLDSQQEKDLLTEFQVKIAVIENALKVGKVLGEGDREEIDRLLAAPIENWDKTTDKAIYEQEAVESLKTL